MVIIDFVDGTKKTYETRGKEKEPWSFDSVEQCYKIETITGLVALPREFVKSMEHYEVDADEKYRNANGDTE